MYDVYTNAAVGVDRISPFDSFEGRRVQIKVVPYWIKNALNRHGLGLDTVLDFSKLRPIMSLEDLAGLKFLEFRDKDSRLWALGDYYSVSLPEKNFHEETKKIEREVFELAVLEAVKKTTLERLTLSHEEFQKEAQYYSWATVGNTFFLIIEKGFINALMDHDSLYSFYASYLQTLNQSVEVWRLAANSEIFKKYLNFTQSKLRYSQNA